MINRAFSATHLNERFGIAIDPFRKGGLIVEYLLVHSHRPCPVDEGGLAYQHFVNHHAQRPPVDA